MGRLMLLEAWTDFESEDGDEKSQAQVADLMPRRVKKRGKIETEDGSDQGWEEYFDYIFPEDEAAKPNLKLLAMAKMWKKNEDLSGDVEEEAEQQEENPTETDLETESRRIDVMADKEREEEEEEENPDADDPTIANESSSSESEEEEEEEDEDEGSSKAKRSKRSK